MSARDFNFASEFPKIGVFSPKFCILDEHFLTKTNFPTIFRQPKIYGRTIAPCFPSTTPQSTTKMKTITRERERVMPMTARATHAVSSPALGLRHRSLPLHNIRSHTVVDHTCCKACCTGWRIKHRVQVFNMIALQFTAVIDANRSRNCAIALKHACYIFCGPPFSINPMGSKQRDRGMTYTEAPFINVRVGHLAFIPFCELVYTTTVTLTR